MTLLQDHDGFISFVDRLGDTYRAKGHNISTTEVEGWLSRHPGVASVNVYAIPMNHYGYDGQLGCAAITLHDASSSQFGRDQHETISQLEQWLRTSESALPAYAVPRFVRVLVTDEGAAPDQGCMSGDSGSERVSVIMKKLKTGLRKDGEFGSPAPSFVNRRSSSQTGWQADDHTGFLIPPGNKDRMYWIEREGAGYVPLTEAAIRHLLSGKAQL